MQPKQRWATDLMHVPVGDPVKFVISLLNEYSRYIVRQEVLMRLDGLSTSLAAQKAIETRPRGADGRPLITPENRSDNASAYISTEFRLVLKENGSTHRRIRPHCPKENGLMERANHPSGKALRRMTLPITWSSSLCSRS